LQQEQQPVLHFAVSACLWGCLQRALAPTVFLQQLGDKFARLATQLLVRYDTWLQEIVTVRRQAATAAAAGSPAPAHQPAGQQQQLQPGQVQPQQAGVVGGVGAGAGAAAGAGGGSSGEVRSGPAAWVPDMALDSAAVICHDADVIKVSPSHAADPF
jgi:hypothetical protein